MMNNVDNFYDDRLTMCDAINLHSLNASTVDVLPPDEDVQYYIFQALTRINNLENNYCIEIGLCGKIGDRNGRISICAGNNVCRGHVFYRSDHRIREKD